MSAFEQAWEAINGVADRYQEEIENARHAARHLMLARRCRLDGRIQDALIHEGWFEGLKSEIKNQDLHDALEAYELSVS